MMESETKLLLASVCVAVVVGLVLFITFQHSPRDADLSDSQHLAVNATRSRVIGEQHLRDESAQKPYVLVEFGDYQCPPCRDLYKKLEAFVPWHSDKLGFLFRNLPLIEIHPLAFRSALYAEAARDQNKFEAMHSILYKGETLKLGNENQYVHLLHLDNKKFHLSLKTSANTRVHADMNDSSALGVNSTPTLILCEPNGKVRRVEFDDLSKLIK